MPISARHDIIERGAFMPQRLSALLLTALLVCGLSLPSAAFADNSGNASSDPAVAARAASARELLRDVRSNSPLMAPSFDTRPVEGAAENASSDGTSVLALLADNDPLPTRYDLREQGLSTPVRSQNYFNTCWAFGAMATMESGLLRQRGGNPDTLDLSELQIAYFHNWQATEEEASVLGAPNQAGEGLTTEGSVLDAGGGTFTAASIMVRGTGAIDEAEAPYANTEQKQVTFLAPGWDGESHEANFWWWEGDWSVPRPLATRSTYQLDRFGVLQISPVAASSVFGDAYEAENSGALIADPSYIDKAKSVIMNRGAVSMIYCSLNDPETALPDASIFNLATGAQFIDSETAANHEVTVVGWDDNFSRHNFVRPAPADGAWIVKNSFGSMDAPLGDRYPWGIDNSGYFYLSYYDASIAEIDWIDPVAPEDETQIVQQYDLLGYTLGPSLNLLSPDPLKAANVFTAPEDMTLESVTAFPAYLQCDVNVQVYLLKDNNTTPEDGDLVASQTFFMGDHYYARIPLDEPVKIAKGQRYAVVQSVEVTLENQHVWVAAVEASAQAESFDGSIATATAVVNPGESFMFYEEEWTDLADLNQETDDSENEPPVGNIMIKAFGNPAQLADGEGVYVAETDDSPAQPEQPAGTDSPDASSPDAADPAAPDSQDSAAVGTASTTPDERQKGEPLAATGDNTPAAPLGAAALAAAITLALSLAARRRNAAATALPVRECSRTERPCAQSKACDK